MRGTQLEGSTVLVTGGGSGIGRLMALDAAARGATVVVWDLSLAAAQAVADEITATGATAVAQQVDVSNRELVGQAAATTRELVGPVDVLINNAGIVTGKRLLDATDDQILRTFDVNVLALFWVTRAFLPDMVARRRGHVVTIASAAGLVGVDRQTDYSASKHAAVGFDESLRQEFRSMGGDLKTTVVCPYYINTGMFDGVQTRFPWLLPILEPQVVATKVLDAIEAGRARVILPPFVRLVPLMRLYPAGFSDRIADFLGVNKSMDHFTGRA